MATKIEWADESFNPITGCTKVSPGCKNCYAERMAKRLAGRFGYPKDEPFRVTLHKDKLYRPFHWRKQRRVFVCSMGDLFHEDVPDAWINDVLFPMWALEEEPVHTWILLTKRPERMKEYFKKCPPLPSNVWVGVSVEDQERADQRIPILLDTPAAVRFVSCEPLLESLDLRPYLSYNPIHEQHTENGREGLPRRYARGFGNRRAWTGVESCQEGLGPLGEEGGIEAVQEGSRRTQPSERISPSEGDDRGSSTQRVSSSARMVTHEGADPGGACHQSQERREVRQSANEFGSRDPERESCSRLSNGLEGRTRRAESGGEIDGYSSRNNPDEVRDRRNHAGRACGATRCQHSGDLRDCPGQEKGEAGRPDRGLRTQEDGEDPAKGWAGALSLVICGGETGPGARPMDPDWARALRDQCKAAGVPFFFKHMSGSAPIPDDLMVREWPQPRREEDR